MNNLQTVWKGARHHFTTHCPTLYPHPYTWVLLLEEHTPIHILMLTPTRILTQGASTAFSSIPATHTTHTIPTIHTTIQTSSALPLLLLSPTLPHMRGGQPMWGENLKSQGLHLCHLWQTLGTNLVGHSSLVTLTARVWAVEGEAAMPRTR